ncbi:hypothetical protein Rhe02_60690 [Rhizocola hellebori]|uniref:Guanylate cyclase domain-containing protein n=1 Tax=Rhizocola hellebori TaxID=1392758 RepID=A0A8J3QE78_9ACTN|nr:AAA family ATPase [Rhizocola hellebori]GIH08002.1 hypothetical protein Rhe02_60690 [Rhizocola hellebori]
MLGELRIHLFGGFRVQVGGQPVPPELWRRSSATALVKLLALSPGHRLHREQAIDTLWPSLSQQAGAARLNKALHFARRALAAEQVRLRDDLLSLEAGVLWVDVDAFEEAARRGDFEEALALYTGDLLPENRFEPWAEPRRDQLRAVLVRLLVDQGLACESGGQPREAIAAFERVIEVEPLHEQAYARLIRLEAAQGFRHVALRWYERLAAGLRDELGVDPSEELRRLHTDLTTGRLPTTVPPAAPAAVPPAALATVPPAAPAAVPPAAPAAVPPALAAASSAAATPALPAPALPAPALPAHAGLAPAIPTAAVEERKLVTVLAADLRRVRGESDPEQARREMSTWTEVLCDVVGRWGGQAQRVIGGGVVAVFGYPAAREDHAARALWAGFEVLQRIPVPVRVGIDTGEIIASATAAPVSLADIGGAVLDAAAWLRESAAPRQVLAAERTRRAAGGGDFRFSNAMWLTREGTPGVVAHRLLSASWAAQRQPRAEPPMVGRDDELRAITSLIDETATSGRPRLLSIVGVAGVGKSRLVREVISAAVHRRPDTKVLRGRCLAAGDGITYWALGEILRNACGIALGEAGRVAQQRLRRWLQPLLSEHIGQSDVEATIFALAATAAIPMPDNPLDTAIPRIVAEELARAWPRLVSALAAGGPTLVVVEDLHWAGAPLLEMLARLASRSTGPVVLLTTARPEFLEEHPLFGTGQGSDMSMISLRPLGDRSSRELVASLPRSGDIGASRRDEIVERAEGNPYFLDQLVAHVADGGSGVLPDTIHATLAARVDALPAAEKQLLQAAAVVGRIFWAEPVGSRVTGDAAETLAALESRGLILARQTSSLTGQTEFAFKHALLRDVAYASLPAGQRARGHAETAAWLEEISRERVGEVIELVAFHYAAAADAWEPARTPQRQWVRAKAFRSLIEAGASARHRNAVAKALDLHEKARHYACGVGETAEALEAIGDDHEVPFNGDAAVAAWQAAVELLRPEPSHVDRRVRLCLKIGQMIVARWGGFRVPPEPDQGDPAIEEGLTVVTDPSVKAHLLSLFALSAGRWAWTGRPDPVPVAQRHHAADHAYRLAVELDSAPLRAQALLGRTAVQYVERDHDSAVATALDLLAFSEQGSNGRDQALANAIACLAIGDVQGDRERALGYARRSHVVSRDLSAHDRMHGTYMVMWCLEQLGRWTEIEPYLGEHLALLESYQYETSCPYLRGGHLVAALALARMGEIARAQQLADLVPMDLEHPGNAESLRAELAVELGDLSMARDLAERLVSKRRRPGPEEVPHEIVVLVQVLEAQADHEALRRYLPQARAEGDFLAATAPFCDRAEALALAAQGDVADAVGLLTGAVEGFDRLGLPLQAARSREHLARLVPGRAAELLRSALDTYTRLGAKTDAARAQP